MHPHLYAQPKQPEKLAFFTPSPGEAAYFEHQFSGYALEARILFNRQHEWPHVMSIHGARADYTKSDVFSFGLQQRDISVLGINLSGHNDASPLRLEETTTGHNVAEAEMFYQYLDHAQQKVIIAYSLGAMPALKLLERHMQEIDKLVLFYPGIYPKAAYDKHFVTELPQILRVPGAYRDNDVIGLLEAFPGQLLLVKGEFDGLDPVAYGKPAGTAAGEVIINGHPWRSAIPEEVITMVLNAVPTARRQLLTVANCDHQMNAWARQHPVEAAEVASQVADFILA